MYLAENVIDLQRSEMNVINLNLQSFNLRTVIEDVAKMFEFRVNCKQLKFSVKISESIPDLAYSDKERIKRVIHTLLGNAVKYTMKGRIIIKAKLDTEEIITKK